MKYRQLLEAACRRCEEDYRTENIDKMSDRDLRVLLFRYPEIEKQFLSELRAHELADTVYNELVELAYRRRVV